MSISDLIERFPWAGKEFALWFAGIYQLKESIFNEAPVKHQISAIYRFLGHELELDDSIPEKKHFEKMMQRFENYEKALHNSDNSLTFEQKINKMPREEIFQNFEKDANIKPYRITIKDALIENKNSHKQTVHVEKEDDGGDAFWDSVKITNDLPF